MAVAPAVHKRAIGAHWVDVLDEGHAALSAVLGLAIRSIREEVSGPGVARVHWGEWYQVFEVVAGGSQGER